MKPKYKVGDLLKYKKSTPPRFFLIKEIVSNKFYSFDERAITINGELITRLDSNTNFELITRLDSNTNFELATEDEKVKWVKGGNSMIKNVFHVQSGGDVNFIRYDYFNFGYSSLSNIKMTTTSILDELYTCEDKAFDKAINFILNNCSGYGGRKSIFNMLDINSYFELNRCSCNISLSTRRGSGNFIIASSTIIERIIESRNEISDVKVDKDSDRLGRYKLIRKDIGNVIVMGYNGEKENDSGLIFHEKDGRYLPIQCYNSEKYYRVINVEGETK
jgi:hypothetical protein